MTPTPSAAQDAGIDDLIDLLQPTRTSVDAPVTVRIPERYGPVVFGGLGIAVTVAAACLDAPDGTRMHSLHGHFLRPLLADPGVPVERGGASPERRG